MTANTLLINLSCTEYLMKVNIKSYYLYVNSTLGCLSELWELVMDREAWRAAIHGVTNSRTRLSNFTFTFHFHGLEKEMATHSSVLAWRIPGTGEPGGLPSMGSHRVGHETEAT